MASVLQWVAYGIAAFVILVSLLNPGGFYVAVFIASILVVVAVVGPFIQEYVLNASQGKWSHRAKQKAQQERDQ